MKLSQFGMVIYLYQVNQLSSMKKNLALTRFGEAKIAHYRCFQPSNRVYFKHQNIVLLT